MIAILVPETNYADYILKEVEHEVVCQKYKIFKCDHQNSEFLLLITGYGKVNIASSLEHLASKYELTGIINIGPAGSLKDKYQILDVIIPTRALQYDIDFIDLGYDLVMLPNEKKAIFSTDSELNDLLNKGAKYVCPNIKSAIIGSSDCFCTTKNAVFSYLSIDVIDNEIGSIAQFAEKHSIPFSGIKIITYYVNKNGAKQFNFYNDEALLLCQRIILNTFK